MNSRCMRQRSWYIGHSWYVIWDFDPLSRLVNIGYDNRVRTCRKIGFLSDDYMLRLRLIAQLHANPTVSRSAWSLHGRDTGLWSGTDRRPCWSSYRRSKSTELSFRLGDQHEIVIIVQSILEIHSGDLDTVGVIGVLAYNKARRHFHTHSEYGILAKRIEFEHEEMTALKKLVTNYNCDYSIGCPLFWLPVEPVWVYVEGMCNYDRELVILYVRWIIN